MAFTRITAVTLAVLAVAGPATAQAAEVPGLSGSSDPCTVALDPGHNGESTNTFDPVTGVLMADYPNGQEDVDALDIARAVRDRVEDAGVRVVLLKDSISDNVTYRERVDRAAAEDAVMGVSIHTTPGADAAEVYPQRVGGFRTGDGADGQSHKVTFGDAATAAESQRFSTMIAGARSVAELRGVPVTDLSFDGREGLWGGNLPVIALIADIPWVYNEFGSTTGGGAHGISAAEKARYVDGLSAGILAGVASSPTCGVAGSVGSALSS
ncbi:N-acetylmuramoyl-L-alanine amidase [Corynebacterium variabile]|uniref:N-acetylmuramoyl-L-alanine amidase n=1 Tax=Corynebacterium variabile TaxID=1727 RepID=UPI00289F2854|nr:N-acetylmuramoyl-L-alanine amidase [Corynebacterium variabile]